MLVTVRSTVTSPFYWLRAGTLAQPTRLGWVQPTVYGSGQAQPRMVGPDPAQFFLLLLMFVVKRKIQKYLFVILQVSCVFFMSFWLISSSIFMLLKIQNSILKYPVFVKISKIQKKKIVKKKKKCFCAYGQVSQN